MQLIREKILFIPQTTQRINFFLTANNSFTGLQENIDEFVAEQTGLSINEPDDAERFRYSPISAITMNFYYYSGGFYQVPSTYQDADFTVLQVSGRSEVILRSFYIMQVYDSPNPSNQTLLHTGYFNGFNFLDNNLTNTLDYNYFTEEEFADLYISNNFVNFLSGETTLYGKLSFYNAKTGELSLFSIYSGETTTPPAPTKDSNLYFEISFSANTFSYNIDAPVYAYEITNQDYIDKINNTLSSFTNEKPTYPTGNAFLNTGKYETQ